MRRRALLGGMLAALAPPALAQTLGRPGQIAMSTADRDVLARTIYGEALGEGECGQIAVAHVVFNRVVSTDTLFHADRSVRAACRRTGQFSCWHAARHLMRLDMRDQGYADLLNLTHYALYLYERGEDVSNGATHYLVRGSRAAWTRHAPLVARIGRHDFYRVR